MVWGDDQYENFREEIIPPFCVLAYDDLGSNRSRLMNERGSPNAWGPPDDTTITVHGSADKGRWLTNELIDRGFDMAYSYRKRENSAFRTRSSTPSYSSSTIPTPARPSLSTVADHGELLRPARSPVGGGLVTFAQSQRRTSRPGRSSPARCFALGRAVAQAFTGTDLRVALVASSSWSHAFLVDKTWRLTPDTESDRRLYGLLSGTATGIPGRQRPPRTSSSQASRNS